MNREEIVKTVKLIPQYVLHEKGQKPHQCTQYEHFVQAPKIGYDNLLALMD